MSAPVSIAGYRLLRELGRGGMATVHLAVQESLGREVALKLLSPQLAADPIAAERFLREGRIAAQLVHRHIVGIHDVGIHAGQPYLTMEYLPCGSVASSEAIAPREALFIVREIAQALDHANAQGVIHRDVKPENILRRADGSHALSDFGIARVVDEGAPRTQEGVALGTPHFMSPEQLQGQPLDGRSDLYSLGVVLYQLLTGRLPYRGTDGWAIGMQHLSAPLPRLPDALARYQPLIDAMMAKQPGQRPANGAALTRLLDALQEGGPVSTPTVPLPQMSLPQLQRRRPRWVWAAGLAALTVLAALAWLWPRTDAPQEDTQGPLAAGIPSIAVLPFANLGGDEDDGYFADGLTEEILNSLANLSDLRVIGRTSSFAYKGRNVDLRSIGRELGVKHVIEGSVRRQGETLRITAQMIEAETGFHAWSQRFDRGMDDAFAIQAEIAAAVAEKFKLSVQPTAAGTQLRGEAQREYLRALGLFGQYGAASKRAAAKILRGIVRDHPDFIPAYLYLGSGIVQADLPLDTTLAELQALADEVQRRQPDSFDARALAAMIPLALNRHSVSYPRARDVLATHRALADQAVNHAELQHNTAVAADLLGEYRIGLVYAERYAALEPHLYRGPSLASRFLRMLGEAEEAEAAARRAIAATPDQPSSYFRSVRHAVAEHRFADALDLVEACQNAGGQRCGNLLGFLYRALRQDDLWREVANPERVARDEAARKAQAEGGYAGVLAWVEAQGRGAADPGPFRDYLTDAALESRDYATALALYRQLNPGLFEAATPILPGELDHALSAGIALHRLGLQDEARKLFERVLDTETRYRNRAPPLEPSLPEVVALAWLGREDEAIAALRRAIERGWFDERGLTEFPLSGSPSLFVDPLRERSDFQQLIREVRERNAAEFAALQSGSRSPTVPI